MAWSKDSRFEEAPGSQEAMAIALLYPRPGESLPRIQHFQLGQCSSALAHGHHITGPCAQAYDGQGERASLVAE